MNQYSETIQTQHQWVSRLKQNENMEQQRSINEYCSRSPQPIKETYKPNLQKVCASAEPRFKDQKASRIERILSNKRLVEMLTERKEKKTIDKSKLLQKMNQIYLKTLDLTEATHNEQNNRSYKPKGAYKIGNCSFRFSSSFQRKQTRGANNYPNEYNMSPINYDTKIETSKAEADNSDINESLNKIQINAK